MKCIVRGGRKELHEGKEYEQNILHDLSLTSSGIQESDPLHLAWGLGNTVELTLAV